MDSLICLAGEELARGGKGRAELWLWEPEVSLRPHLLSSASVGMRVLYFVSFCLISETHFFT